MIGYFFHFRVVELMVYGTLGWLMAVPGFSADQRIIVEEAEKWAKKGQPVYRDMSASGKKSVVLFLKDQESVKRFYGLPDKHPLASRYGRWMLKEKDCVVMQPKIPVGVYNVTAYVTARPVEYMHRLSLFLKVNDESIHANASWFNDTGDYIPITLQVNHPGGPMSIRVQGCGKTGFDGMRGNKSKAEEEFLEKLKKQREGHLIGDDSGNKEGEGGEDIMAELEGAALITSINYLEPVIACDRVVIEKIADLSARVTRVWVDKVHYRPGEEVKAEVDLQAVGEPGDFTLTVYEIREDSQHRQVYEKDVRLEKNRHTEKFAYRLGKEEFGRELLATIRPKGITQTKLSAESFTDPLRHFPGCGFEVFGVSQNPYQIGITADGGPQDTADLTREAAAAIMKKNKALYANYFERFAWAPSDFGKQTPDRERFWSGQTQYAGSITGFRTLLDEAHKVGIKAFTYANTVAAGPDGVKIFQRFPHFFHTSAPKGLDGDSMGTFIMERWLKNEYDSDPSCPFQGRWRVWYNFRCQWGDGLFGPVDYAAEDIAKGAAKLGWDGVRWDGHFRGQMDRFKKRMKELRPDFIYGYNICFGDPGSELFLPRGDWKDFHECAKGGGMMMDESLRSYSHTNWSQKHWTKGKPVYFYEAICHEGDYIRRIEGIPLFIMFDMGSELDRVYNVLYGLAAGEIYTYHTTPGWWPYGNLTKWLTRYSAYVWSKTKRLKNPESFITITDKDGGKAKDYPLFWKESCWVRDLDPAHKQVLLRIVNPPRYPVFCDRAQTPSLDRNNVQIFLNLPEGVEITRVVHASPDLVTGHQLLQSNVKNDVCTVTVPKISTFSVLVFDVTSANGAFKGEPFPVTTPVKDAVAYMKTAKGKELLKKMEEKAVKAGIARSSGLYVELKERGRLRYDLDKNLDAEDEREAKTKKYLTETMKKPKTLQIERNGVLDVHHSHGLFAWLNRIEQAVGLLGGGNLSKSWMIIRWGMGKVRRDVDEFPATYGELFKHDVLILDNIHAEELGLYRRIMIKDFVESGGGLLIFGGHYNLSCGLDQGTWIGEMLPVTIKGYKQFAINNAKGFPLAPADSKFFPENIDWSQKPSAFYVDVSPLKKGARVLVKAGDHPAIVARTFGKGRVIVVLMNQHGDPAEGLLPYWEWKSWPRLIGSCIEWLAQGYKDKKEIVRAKRAKDPALPDPEMLLLEGGDLEDADFSKKLLASCGNVIDRESAKAILECSLDHVGKVNDVQILTVVTDSVRPYIDKSFAPMIGQLLDQNLGEFQALGLQLVGMVGGEKYLPKASVSLKHKQEVVRREAIMALGAMKGNPKAVKLLQEYIKKGTDFRFLAATMLVKLRIKGGIAQALNLLTKQECNVRDLKCGKINVYNNLYGGMSFKLTFKERKKLKRSYDEVRRYERWARSDLALFNQLIPELNKDQIDEAVTTMSQCESEDIVPFCYTLLGRLDKKDLKAYRPMLEKAKLKDLRLLVE